MLLNALKLRGRLVKYQRFVYSVGSLSRSLSVFVLQIIAVRFLSVDGYGAAMILLAPFLAIQVYIGTISAELFSRGVSHYGDNHGIEISRQDISRVIEFEFKANVWFFLVSILGLIFLSSYFETLSREFDGFSIALLLLFGISTIYYQVIVQIYLIKSGLLRISACYFIEAAIAPFLVGILLTLESSSNMLILGLVIKNILALLLLWVFFRKSWISSVLTSKHREVSTIIGATIPFQKLSLSLKMLWTNLDIVVVGFISGTAAAGEFRIIKSIAAISSLLAAPWWNGIRSKLIEFVASGKFGLLTETIKNAALQLSPIVVIGLGAFFFSDGFFEAVYLLETGFHFKAIFGVYLFGFMVSNVLTAWGRYIQVITGSTRETLYLNIFMVSIIVVSSAVNLYLSIPIPIPAAIGGGLLCSSLYYWSWLRRKRLEAL